MLVLDRPAPPVDTQALLTHARSLAGQTLGQIANRLHIPVPDDLQHTKGWQGQLIEIALGGVDTTFAGPDFPKLGIELKTIPLDYRCLPKESTYVCAIELSDIHGQQWKTSLVYKKLKQVLWIPIEADKHISIAERHLGMPLLWSPDETQEEILKTDWEEHMEKISLGCIAEITAHMGNVLQVRPKAASGKIRRKGSNAQGEINDMLPRGFYLRPSFTTEILKQHFIHPA
ncbi:MAG: DNA mismatch repair endonuclease MutH [Gammaproteobacteria bacterium]|nr:DNA mismatch repair endonuclease MutH [Gammaproteobacteria bacterium]